MQKRKQRSQTAPEDRQRTQQEYNSDLPYNTDKGYNSEDNYEGYGPDENDEGYAGDEVMDALMQEEAELKKKYPEFDLKYMLRTNEGFARRMLRGYTMEDAYILALNEKGRRGIRENGTRPSSGAVTRRDPQSMSDGDFQKYINNLMNR